MNSYFEKYEDMSLNIYMIFYFEAVGKSNVRTKSKCFIQRLQFGNLMLLVVALE